MSSIVVTLSLEVAVDCISTRRSDREDPTLGEAVDCIPPGPSDVVDPSLGVVVDSIPPGPPDVVDSSLGLTGGVLLGWGLPSQGSLVDVERAVIIEGGR